MSSYLAPRREKEIMGSGRLMHEIGGADRDRTGDLKLAKLALSQLSYGPSQGTASIGLRGQDLSFRHPARFYEKNWWAWDDSNVRPHAYQACALTT